MNEQPEASENLRSKDHDQFHMPSRLTNSTIIAPGQVTDCNTRDVIRTKSYFSAYQAHPALSHSL